MWLLSHSWQEKGISTCQILSLSLSCSLSLCSVSKNISSDNVNCSTAVLNITHVSPPAILYLLIKADRQINQGSVCAWSRGGLCTYTHWCVYVALRVKFTESEPLCLPVLKRWLTAVMSSWLQTDICQKPSLWRRIWGVFSVQETASCTTAPPRRAASPTAERCLQSASADEIMSILICITFCQTTVYLEPLLWFLLCIAGYCIMWSCCYYCKSNVAWTHNWIYSDDY